MGEAFAAWRESADKGSTSAMRIECPYVLKDKRGKVVSNLCF
jgi:hypothetical protein